jgi:hypothetical protein
VPQPIDGGNINIVWFLKTPLRKHTKLKSFLKQPEDVNWRFSVSTNTTWYLNFIQIRSRFKVSDCQILPMCTNFKEGQCQFCSQIKNDSNSVWYDIIPESAYRIRDVGQPNILVPLVKRTTSFSYFYGSEWKMVIYEYQMPKTSCFSFPNTA